MGDADVANMRELIALRFGIVIRLLTEIDQSGEITYRPVDALCSLLVREDSPLNGIVIHFQEPDATGPTYVDWAAASAPPGANRPQVTFRIPDRTVRAFADVFDQLKRTDPRRDFWHIDIFILHELIHSFQGMERGRHRGLGRQSEDALLAIDYESDAVAVLTLFYLALRFPAAFFGRFEALKIMEEMTAGKVGSKGLAGMLAGTAFRLARGVAHIVPYWGTLERIIHAQIWHMTVFTATMRRSLSLIEASEGRFPIAKIERTFAWYLHYFRARYFVRSARVTDFHLMRRPFADFRNLRAATAIDVRHARRDWPEREKTLVEAAALEAQSERAPGAASPGRPISVDPADPELILTATGPYGLVRVERWRTPASGGGEYAALFTGLFSGKAEAAKPFFDSLLTQAPWLWGQPADPVRAEIVPQGPAVNAKADFVTLDEATMRSTLLADFSGL